MVTEMSRTKRKYKKHPGLSQAARDLGVSYQHLRRVVVTGERISPPLSARFNAWQRQHQLPDPVNA